jgi:hypothetical protein
VFTFSAFSTDGYNNMNNAVLLLLACIWVTALAALLFADELTRERPVVVIPDFISDDEDNAVGNAYADALRLRLRRHGYTVIDRITTRQFASALGAEATDARLTDLALRTEASLVVTGQVHADGDQVTVTVCQFTLDCQGNPVRGEQVFTNDSQRARAVITTAIAEDILGEQIWSLPEVGDEALPDNPGELIDIGGDFESAEAWQAPNNVATFIEPADDHTDHGTVLRLRTDLAREPYLAYQAALACGEASPDEPPTIASDTTYASIAGVEGVRFSSDWIPAQPGRRYWLNAETLTPAATSVLIFVKGFANIAPAEEPAEYRQVYQWRLTCNNTTGQWESFAGAFPPEGGLPDSVDVLRLDIFACWPGGDYRVDNIRLYLVDETQ